MSAGIMVTAKQRQEFRIQLQKRAFRRAEKKIECLEDDITWKEVRINSPYIPAINRLVPSKVEAVAGFDFRSCIQIRLFHAVKMLSWFG